MMEQGLDTPGILQLAGEDLDLNPFEFASLTERIFQELDWDLAGDDAHYQYAMGVAQEVLNGDYPAEEGFMILSQAAIDTDYNKAFLEFYYWEDNAELLKDVPKCNGCYGDGSMRRDYIEKWMHLFAGN